MGFDAAIGHTLEIRDGVYTGRSIVNGTPHPGIAWMDKVSALKRFIESRKMNVDIAQSIMIGDSEGDVPLLSFVGRPIAFNPSLPLARIARARGWRIVVERKDVVYDIKDMRLVPVSGQSPRVSYGNAGRSPKA